MTIIVWMKMMISQIIGWNVSIQMVMARVTMLMLMMTATVGLMLMKVEQVLTHLIPMIPPLTVLR